MAVDVSGERVVAVKALEVDYSVFALISQRARRRRRSSSINRSSASSATRPAGTWRGWSSGRSRRPIGRGPTRPISLPSIEITDGSVSIDDTAASAVYRCPRASMTLDVKGSFEYAPVHYSVTLDDVSFRGTSPDLTLQQLTGKLAVRDDNLYLGQRRRSRPARRGHAQRRHRALSADAGGEARRRRATCRCRRSAAWFRPRRGYALHPAFDVKADGPAEQLEPRSRRAVRGRQRPRQVTADVQAPDFARARRGRSRAAEPRADPARSGAANRPHRPREARSRDGVGARQRAGDRSDQRHVRVQRPACRGGRLQARDVKVTATSAGSRDHPRRPRGGIRRHRHGRGFIVTPAPGRALAFDLRGAADRRGSAQSAGVDRRSAAGDQPVGLGYHVTGEGTSIRAPPPSISRRSEGATFASGTTAEFALGPDDISYSARGTVANLDLHRLGSALKIDALAQPTYDSRINGSFESREAHRAPARAARAARRRSSSAVSTMKLDATGTLTDSDGAWRALPNLAFDAHLDHGALNGRANGAFEGFNPGKIANRKDLEGSVPARSMRICGG